MKKAFFRSGLALIVLLVFAAAVVAFWRPGLLRGQPNHGHQLGGDLFRELSGNTLECFAKGIEEYESDSSWLYSECDIRETKDNELIVFHDWDISSIPNTVGNRAAIGGAVGDQPICDLTMAEIDGLTLNCGGSIPTLEQVLQKAAELNLKKPLLLEFKYLHSDNGREKLLELALKYRDLHDVEIHFLSFVRNVNRSFPKPKKWLERFSQNGFRVYQVFRPKNPKFDMCETWD